mgnify:CR=1 FL=1
MPNINMMVGCLLIFLIGCNPIQEEDYYRFDLSKEDTININFTMPVWYSIDIESTLYNDKKYSEYFVGVNNCVYQYWRLKPLNITITCIDGCKHFEFLHNKTLRNSEDKTTINIKGSINASLYTAKDIYKWCS